MSSHSSRVKEGAEPKRQRGHLRVAAILDTASALFADQGYEAATMTEIAARSSTAIGSLYRFFPTKDAVADALLERYGKRVDVELTALAGEAAKLGGDALADRLVDFMLETVPERSVLITLLDARSNSTDKRMAIRALMLQRLGKIVATANAQLSAPEREARAQILLQLLKMVTANAKSGSRRLRDEAREAVRCYMRDRIAGKGRS